MPAGKSSISANSRLLPAILFAASINLKSWPAKRDSRSKSITRTMALSPLQPTGLIVQVNLRNVHSVELEHTIRMELLSEIFALSLSGHELACFIWLCTGLRSQVSNCGPWRWIMLYGSSIDYPTSNLVSVPTKSGRLLEHLMTIFDELMYLDVQSTSSSQSFKMARRYRNGPLELALGCSLASLLFIHRWYL